MMENDYDRISKRIGLALSEFAGNAHKQIEGNGDSITITKDGFISTVIMLERLRAWVDGLAQSHRDGDYRKQASINYIKQLVSEVSEFSEKLEMANVYGAKMLEVANEEVGKRRMAEFENEALILAMKDMEEQAISAKFVADDMRSCRDNSTYKLAHIKKVANGEIGIDSLRSTK